jgi:hypothetical protein
VYMIGVGIQSKIIGRDLVGGLEVAIQQERSLSVEPDASLR